MVMVFFSIESAPREKKVQQERERRMAREKAEGEARRAEREREKRAQQNELRKLQEERNRTTFAQVLHEGMFPTIPIQFRILICGDVYTKFIINACTGYWIG